MVLEFKPTEFSDRYINKVLDILQVPQRTRQAARDQIESWLTNLIWSQYQCKMDAAANLDLGWSQSDLAKVQRAIEKLLEAMKPFDSSNEMSITAWYDVKGLPDIAVIRQWLSDVNKLAHPRQPKPGPTTAKPAAEIAASLAAAFSPKIAKRQIAKAGALLMGNPEAEDAVYHYLKGKKQT